MPPSAPAPFARSLAALDREAFVRFVAAVHDAREGATVEREGGVLAVREARSTRRVLPLAARRGPFRGPTPVGPVDGPVDEVVAQVDAGAARALADRRDARYRSPADLHARVRHGLPPDRADRLLDEHLDIPDSGSDSGGTWRVPAVAATLIAGLLVVALVGHGGAIASLTPAGAAGDAAPAVETTATATATSSGPSAPARDYPPGVDATGVTSAAALADAHGDAVDEGGYRWTVIRRSGAPAGDGRGTDSSLTTYGGRNRTYVRADGPNGTYVRERVRLAGGGGPAVSRAERYVERYLAGTDGDAMPVYVDGRPGYFLTVHGRPTGLRGDVSDFMASALVTREGLVVQLDVSYTRRRDGRSYTVSLFFEYERLPDDGAKSGDASARNATTAARNTTTATRN
ncbi:MAG: hypothetical protein ABEH47_04425, partial [Haloferacaceae archaeon]